MALWSLICGIGSLMLGCCCWLFGVPLSITAIVLGVLSLGKIDKNPGFYKGKELAYVGIVTGGLGLVGQVVSFAIGGASILLEHLGYRP